MRDVESEPPITGVRALAATLGATAVTKVQRLRGGFGAATHAVDVVTPHGRTQRLVLKRYRAGDPDAAREWRGLGLAQELGVPAPEPVVADLAGAWFGAPAVVMTRLSGRPAVARAPGDSAWAQMAAALAGIHGAPVDRQVERVLGAQPGHVWARPQRPARSGMVRRAHQLIERACAPETEPVLIHGDFRPTNLLFSRGRLSGVVDWSFTGRGPPAYDVASCRGDMVVLFGVRAADRFLAHYRTRADLPPRDLALWDLYAGLIALEHVEAWLVAYGEQGATAPPELARGRLLGFTARALTLCSALGFETTG